MKKHLLDILLLNEDGFARGSAPQVNLLGVFVVSTWIMFVVLALIAGVYFKYFSNDSELVRLKGDLDEISETVRDRQFRSAKSIDELDQSLLAEIEAGFRSEIDHKDYRLKEADSALARLRKELEASNAQCDRYAGALDRHRD